MATKPSVRIPLWGTDHAPAAAGSSNSPQGTAPKIEPSSSLIASGFTGPPASPDYEIVNALLGDGGEWLDFLAALFDDDGAYTGDGSNGVFELETDTTALAVFQARNVNGGGDEAELRADRLGVGSDGGWLERLAAGHLRHNASVAEQRLDAQGFGPIAQGPAGSSFSDRSQGLYLHNLIKAKAQLNITGSSGAYDIELTDFGGGALEYNVASASMASDGTISLNFTDSLTNGKGTFRQLWIQLFDTGASAVLRSEQTTPSSGSTLRFRLLWQDTSGGAWTVLEPSETKAGFNSTFMNVIAI